MQPTTPTTFSDDFNDAMGQDPSRFAGDARLYVEFYRKPVMHPGKSQEAGRAIYEETDYIKLAVPGDKLSMVDRPVNSMDASRFADRYAKWKAGQQEAVTGTPLSSLPNMTPAKVEEYKFFNIVTVEQLAEAPDGVGQKFMGFNGDKNRAKAFLEVAKNNAPLERMTTELQQRDAKIEELMTRIDAMQAQMSKPAKRSTQAETTE